MQAKKMGRPQLESTQKEDRRATYRGIQGQREGRQATTEGGIQRLQRDPKQDKEEKERNST